MKNEKRGNAKDANRPEAREENVNRTGNRCEEVSCPPKKNGKKSDK